MADENESIGRKAVKVGVHVGRGRPPGYRWDVAILDRAFDEAMGFLNAEQYEHMASQVRELARLEEPTQGQTVDVRPIENFHEIRDKGGILGKINVRVFFAIHKSSRTIVILGAIKKENEGATPPGEKVTMRRRLRLYLGDQTEA